MYSITRIHIIALPATPQTQAALATRIRESSQANFANHIRQAAAHLAQAKLFIRRAMRTGPGTRIRTRRLLETLAAIQQVAIESAQKLAVSE